MLIYHVERGHGERCSEENVKPRQMRGFTERKPVLRSAACITIRLHVSVSRTPVPRCYKDDEQPGKQDDRGIDPVCGAPAEARDDRMHQWVQHCAG